METRHERQLRRTIVGTVLAAAWIGGCAVVSPQSEPIAISKTATYDAAWYGGIGCASGEMYMTPEETDGATQTLSSEDVPTDEHPAGPTLVDTELAVSQGGPANAPRAVGAVLELSRVPPAADVCKSP